MLKERYREEIEMEKVATQPGGGTCTKCQTNEADPSVNGGQWCVPCYNADVREYRAEANRNRRPRRKRQPLHGDFATIAMLNGISTDGTGRR